MELFRMLAMFLVLVVHADFFSLGRPTLQLYDENPTFFWGQYFFESLTIGCVNMFVLLSGWFGIRPSKKSFLNLIFQCLFFSIGIYVGMTCLGLTDTSFKGILKGVLQCFYLYKTYWFVLAYIGLYILAPVINSFIEHSSQRNLEYFLIAFFAFQSLFGWLFPSISFFVRGYSTLSFVGLYVLARYCKIYGPSFTAFSKRTDFLIYITVSLLIMFVAGISNLLHLDYITDIMYAYSNPLVIIASLYLLLFFSKLQIKYLPLINTIAVSNFSVYLFHANPNILAPYFAPYVKGIVASLDGIVLLLALFLSLVGIYAISVCLDRIRIFLWNKISVLL